MFLLKNYRYGTGTEAISYLKKKKTMYDPIIPIYSIEDSKKNPLVTSTLFVNKSALQIFKHMVVVY